MGCVCIGPVSIYSRTMYPKTLNLANAQVIFNLCVSSEFQCGGVGRQLLRAAYSAVKCPLYLFILKNGKDLNVRADIEHVMSARVTRLKKTYEKLGCEYIQDMGDVILLRVA
jgi:ribosomal protein S18 acetylase RimI-like enzyme